MSREEGYTAAEVPCAQFAVQKNKRATRSVLQEQ